MLNVLKKLLQQSVEFNRNNHPSRIFELLHGIYSKISVFDRIFFLSIGKLRCQVLWFILLREQIKTTQNVRKGEFTLQK